MLALFASSVSVALTANYASAPPVNVIAVVVAIAGALVFLVMCMVLFGTGVCRLRDRGKSAFWIVWYYVVPCILAVLANGPEGESAGLNCIAVALMVWSVIDLGILKGADDRLVAA